MSRTERGGGGVLAMPLLGVVVLVAALGAALGAVVVAERRVQAAADLAALAGATAAQHGHDGCAAAARLARRGRAELSSCAVRGADVTVEARIVLESVLGRSVTVRARARAGPLPGAGQPGGP